MHTSAESVLCPSQKYESLVHGKMLPKLPGTPHALHPVWGVLIPGYSTIIATGVSHINTRSAKMAM